MGLSRVVSTRHSALGSERNNTRTWGGLSHVNGSGQVVLRQIGFFERFCKGSSLVCGDQTHGAAAKTGAGHTAAKATRQTARNGHHVVEFGAGHLEACLQSGGFGPSAGPALAHRRRAGRPQPLGYGHFQRRQIRSADEQPHPSHRLR